MELQEFIKTSLIEIGNAVTEANGEIKKSKKTDTNFFFLKFGSEKDKGAGIHFDLAVTSSTVKQTDGRVKAGISVFGAGIGTLNKATDEKISRISFTIEIGHLMA